ncbi:maleylpyruvate isomerase N-terminal domain-containing protein [Hymenobacter sp. AT01-02]|uniref:maleylpyruvate isomerase N-terminal domain-containing protein n=1 Tax=Hymenobacter sp. AT01-02 TaxID=1571877 RepID=UPI0005F0E1EF|nr:maleylpyruvate isomerase N-terminal domain-containing protein [Hymenobacter sp. AT01-02]
MVPAVVPNTLPLFAELDRLLSELLRRLTLAEWEQPTVVPGWRVRDVALHLLDGNLRSMSMLRDGHFGGPGPATSAYADVVEYLNALNQTWVAAGQRLSPAVLAWLLEVSGPAYTSFLHSLDPASPAQFAVAWAGEAESTNHFHIAREYTEKWHHQQQIRQAMGQEAALLLPTLYHPFLATCVHALPHHYRAVEAAPGTTVQFTISGPAGGTWFLHRSSSRWEVGCEYVGSVQATIDLPEAAAWRLFTKSLPPAEAAAYLTCQGPESLTNPVFSLLAIMA